VEIVAAAAAAAVALLSVMLAIYCCYYHYLVFNAFINPVKFPLLWAKVMFCANACLFCKGCNWIIVITIRMIIIVTIDGNAENKIDFFIYSFCEADAYIGESNWFII
jgi:hypothetical protein